MNSITYTESGNEEFSGKPIISRTKGMTPYAAPSVNAELDKRKFTSGKTGLSRTTPSPKIYGRLPYHSRPFLESPHLNLATLTGILRGLNPNNNWVACPKCNEDWNRLTPNGMCAVCDPEKE